MVSSDQVHPHEVADPAREERIQQRLHEDGILRDPLMVGTVPDVEGFVLLDGTNRQRALHNLGLPFVLVQVIDYADVHTVQLRTWCHAARMALDEIANAAIATPNVSRDALPLLGTDEALNDPTTLAVLLDGRHGVILSRPPGNARTRSEALRGLVEHYESVMERIDCEPEELEERAKERSEGSSQPSTLVAFPPFSRSQVVSIALNRALIPAGITRHMVLTGRALRVNVPLEMLSGDWDSDSANDALKQHLSKLRPRVYREPTVLYDS